jgi:tetraacyldisaccharide 4'-kinase
VFALEAAFLSLIRGERRGVGAMAMRFGLRLASWPYGFAVWLRNRAFDRGWKTVHRVGVPVVSIGNLTTGGTGKTPCVEYVARYFRDVLDLQTTILSRGYGAEAGRNDEAMVLEENCPDVPHLQGPDRVAIAQTAIEELEAEVLVLDDGFQHRRLGRDVDLVLIDATNPWGYGSLLPRGLLRESPRELKRAHAVLITRCDLANEAVVAEIRGRVTKLAPTLPIAESTHRPDSWVGEGGKTAPLESLKGRPVAGFCGIGNPEAFRETLRKLGIEPMAWRTFADHHRYTREDIEDLRRWARELPPEAAVVTTQKDLVKIRLDRLGDREMWALKIRLDVHAGLEELEKLLRGAVTPEWSSRSA